MRYCPIAGAVPLSVGALGAGAAGVGALATGADAELSADGAEAEVSGAAGGVTGGAATTGAAGTLELGVPPCPEPESGDDWFWVLSPATCGVVVSGVVEDVLAEVLSELLAGVLTIIPAGALEGWVTTTSCALRLDCEVLVEGWAKAIQSKAVSLATGALV